MSPQDVKAYLEKHGLAQEIVAIASTVIGASALPTKLPWQEGIDYAVLPGDASKVYEIPVRIRDSSGETFQINTTPGSPMDPAPNFWKAYDFKMLFTTAERTAIRAFADPKGAAANADVYDFMDLLDTAAQCGKMIIANDPHLNAGLDLLTAENLIAAGRKAEILG